MTSAARTLTQGRVRELFDVDLETGTLVRRSTVGGVMVGSVVGTHDGAGYLQVGIDGRRYLVHRVIWLHVHGETPPTDIDHINGARSDNRLANLRPATRAENNQNKRSARPGKRGALLGAYWRKREQRWIAAIRTDGKLKNLGFFDSAEDAHAAYVAAKRILHPYCTI